MPRRIAGRLALGLIASTALGLTLADAGRAQTAPEAVAASALAVPAATLEQGPTFQPSEAAALALPQQLEPVAAAPTPAPAATPLGTGIASFYADRFNGQRTASGERFDNRALTAAHRTLPFGSRVRVTNPATGASVVVRITDRGPFTRGRTIDVSRAAAEELGLVRAGHGRVELELLEG